MNVTQLADSLLRNLHYTTWLGASQMVVAPIEKALVEARVNLLDIDRCRAHALALRGQHYAAWSGGK